MSTIRITVDIKLDRYTNADYIREILQGYADRDSDVMIEGDDHTWQISREYFGKIVTVEEVKE